MGNSISQHPCLAALTVVLKCGRGSNAQLLRICAETLLYSEAYELRESAQELFCSFELLLALLHNDGQASSVLRLAVIVYIEKSTKELKIGMMEDVESH